MGQGWPTCGTSATCGMGVLHVWQAMDQGGGRLYSSRSGRKQMAEQQIRRRAQGRHQKSKAGDQAESTEQEEVQQDQAEERQLSGTREGVGLISCTDCPLPPERSIGKARGSAVIWSFSPVVGLCMR